MRFIAVLLCLVSTAAAAQPARDIDAALASFADEFAGVVRVERAGTLVHERAYGLANHELDVANAPHTGFKLHALSRMMTAAVAHRAADQGRLSLEGSVCDWLSPCPDSWAGVTLRNLLNHTSGIPDLSARMEAAWSGSLEASLAAVIDRAGDAAAPDRFPNEDYRASDFDYVLAARILEIAYGAPFASVMSAQLFEPSGMDDSGVEPAPAAGAPAGPLAIKGLASAYDGSAAAPQRALAPSYAAPGARGIHATAEDVADFADALFGERLTTAKMLDAMLTPDFRLSSTYAFGVETVDRNGRLTHRHGSSGDGYAASLSVYPDHDLTLVILSNQGFAPVAEMRRAIEAALLESGA